MKTAEELFAEALQLEDAGEDTQAFQAWKNLAKIHPDPRGLAHLANLAIDLGELDEAKTAFQRAIALDHGFRPAYLALPPSKLKMAIMEMPKSYSGTLFESKRTQALTACLELPSMSSEGQIRRVKVTTKPWSWIRHRKDWGNAQSLYERALTIESDSIVTHMNFGRMLKKKGDKKGVKVHLELALLLDPTYETAERLLREIEE